MPIEKPVLRNRLCEIKNFTSKNSIGLIPVSIEVQAFLQKLAPEQLQNAKKLVYGGIWELFGNH